MKQTKNHDFQINNIDKSVVLAFIFLIIFRILLSNRLPNQILAGTPHDDGWLVSHAIQILKGNWLGGYDQYTLIKGSFSPLFMAFSAAIGLSFTGLNTVAYCFSCVVFILAMKPMIKNNWVTVIVFALLLFNPISYAFETGQRVYRNSMGQWEILLVFGSLIAVHLRNKIAWEPLYTWNFLCGLSLGFLILTREDVIWVYPFVILIISNSLFREVFKSGLILRKVLIIISPLIIAFLTYSAAVALNLAYYGAPVLNDRNGGNFAKVAGDLYAIAPNQDDYVKYNSKQYEHKYYTLYVSTMEKAFDASPELNKISVHIRDAIRMWASWENPNNGEVSTDHMLFALRDGVKRAGYYSSLHETEAFYGRVHNELQSAFKRGDLVQAGGVSVSPLLKRINVDDLTNALWLMPRALSEIVNYKDVNVRAVPAVGSSADIKKFGLVAGGDYFTSQSSLNGSGWAFIMNDNIRLQAGLFDKDSQFIASVPLRGGEDVYQGLKSNYQNAKNSRFQFDVEGYDLNSGVTLQFFDKAGRYGWKIPANGSATCGLVDDMFHYCIDQLKSDSNSSLFYNVFVMRANLVIDSYRQFIPFISVLAVVIYLLLTYVLILHASVKDTLEKIQLWLVPTGLGLTFIFFLYIMCVITITSFNALIYLYTAPAYILLLMFCVFTISSALEVFLDKNNIGKQK